MICGGMIFFLLYLLPWHNLPSISLPIPSPSSYSTSKYREILFVDEDDPRAEPLSGRGGLMGVGSNGGSPGQPNPSIPAYYFRSNVPGLIPYRLILESNITFNVSHSDVLVLLHIQKTGGTSFEKHIVQDLQIQNPCVCWKRRKRCKCTRPLSSSTSTYEPCITN